MNRIPAALRQIVRSDRHLPVRPDYCVVLREDDPGATLHSLNINCRGCEHLFAFKLDFRDAQNHPVPLSEHTSKTRGSKWNKVCDGVFVWHATDEMRWRVLVCDLKSTRQHGSDWIDQLRSSACFVEYLFALLRWFYPGLPHTTEVQYHAITFHGGPALLGQAKRQTGIGSNMAQSPGTLETPRQVPVSNHGHEFLRRLCG